MSTPLDAGWLRSTLVEPEGPYAELDVVASTGSTNADLTTAVADGAQDRTVLIAEEQTAGSGRRARSWSSPRGTGLYLSVLLRPIGVEFANLGSLSIVAGLALMDMATDLGAHATLKWPNDLLAADESGKCAGILAEAAASDEAAVVLGIGLNVTRLRAKPPPGPGGIPPVSLSELGCSVTDRTIVAERLLRAFAPREQWWRDNHGDLVRAGILDEYRERCATIGQQVKVVLADGTLTANAVDVDARGQLVVDTDDGARRTIFAGDVVHVRAAT